MTTAARSAPVTNTAPARKGKNRKTDTGLKNLWRFMGYTRPYRWMMTGATITGLLRLVLPLYMPVFVKGVIDRVLTAEGLDQGERIAELWGMLPLVGILLVVHAAVTLGRVYWGHAAAANAVQDIRHYLYDHLQRLSIEFHNRRPTGSVVARVMNDVGTAQTAFDLLYIQGTQQALTALIISGYLLWLDWQWALISFAVLPAFFLTTTLVRGHVRNASRHVLETNSRISGHLQERMAMIREVQSFTAEDYEKRRVQGQVRVLKGYVLRQVFLRAVLLASSEVTRALGLIVMLVFGVYRVLNGHATVGDVTAFYLYVGMLLAPMEFFSNLFTNLYETAIAADRVFEFFDTTPKIKDAPNAHELKLDHAPEVRFENITFAYPDKPDQAVLHNVNLHIQPGWRVVLVGGSGSGKSTLINLLLRFYNPSSGQVLIGENDVQSVTTQSLRRNIAIVPQQAVLFRGTIRDNILYGRRGASDEDIRAAAAAANAEPFILNLPDGYDTVVGERGVGLSGGQVQRIAIARAFLKDPAILVMDEATSNLDAESEALVLEALDRLSSGRTTFIIAHRLAVARTADMIVVLGNGRVIEQGTHNELHAKGSAYRELWTRQMMDGVL